MEEAKILRPLAYRYMEIARSQKNRDTIELHRAVNDLESVRPVVLIDEVPWSEMNHTGELTLHCSDPFLRELEWMLRTTLYKHKYMPADMIVRPYIPIQKVIHSTGVGLSVEEETIATDEDNPIISHQYHDQLQTADDLAKIRNPVLTYDAQETQRRYQLAGDVLGDLVPVRITGIPFFGVTTFDDIARYRGVTNLLMDLADRPDHMHAIVRKLTDAKLSYLDQAEQLGLFDPDPYSLHCTPIHTNELPGPDFAGGPMTRKNIWGRGTAQIFASVSREMHDEFDIQYMKETIGQCALSYYGCCEPLDRKIDIIEQLPNLRKVSITPWADVNRAAEAISGKYVLAAKPNPSAVAVPRLNQEALQEELAAILEACRRTGCPADIVLKDISTCCGRPQNIFEWEQTAMSMVRNL